MPAEYIPIGVLIAVAILFAGTTLLVSWLTSQKALTNVAKDQAYECGLPAATEGHVRFSVKFYLVAMLFILFDIEVVFLYPWAVVYKDLLREGTAIFFSMLKKGAFKWK
jgi:NADH-quinone oxidoreductase subunit A